MHKKCHAMALLLFSLLIAGCRGQDKSLYPLKEGEKWKYQMSIRSAEGAAATIPLNVTNMPRRVIGNVSVTPQKIEANGSTGFAFVGEDSVGVMEVANQRDNAVEPEVSKSPKYYLHLPVKQGDRWESQSQTVLFSRNVPFNMLYTTQGEQETVTVPAGTFQGCVKVTGNGKAVDAWSELLGNTNVTVEQTSWFCPGVGLVRQLIKETARSRLYGGGEISLQLEFHGEEP